MSLYPITFQPLFKERVWGGRRLEELFGKSLPESSLIGESWEITDRPEAVSVIGNGPMKGRNLRWLMEAHGRELLGRPVAPGERFPWLMKILDAREDLSLQVHPPSARAAALGGEPKTEMWYFASTEPGSKIYVGLKPGVTREEFLKRTADGSVADCFHVETPSSGDVMFVPSGRVHALGGGSVVFEIQQNSDTTYRVFDWNRLGLDGQPRELHVESSMNSIDFSDVAPGLVQSPWTTEGSLGRRSLVSHSAFAIDEVRIAEGGSVPDTRPQNAFSVLAVIQGGLQLEGGGESVPVFPGGFVLLPGCLSPVMIEAERGTTLLRVLPSNPESSG